MQLTTFRPGPALYEYTYGMVDILLQLIFNP